MLSKLLCLRNQNCIWDGCLIYFWVKIVELFIIVFLGLKFLTACPSSILPMRRKITPWASSFWNVVSSCVGCVKNDLLVYYMRVAIHPILSWNSVLVQIIHTRSFLNKRNGTLHSILVGIFAAAYAISRSPVHFSFRCGLSFCA